jgi:hypothetical protein
MGQNLSWENNRSLASQEFLRILWTSELHYRIHKRKPPVPILNRINQDYAPQPIF